MTSGKSVPLLRNSAATIVKHLYTYLEIRFHGTCRHATCLRNHETTEVSEICPTSSSPTFLRLITAIPHQSSL
ncbi:unnamed protein product [Cylicocyclus nassatus]|uniref:Uncharacterized protein n=1 Tax=Cylicocyclus nassatus TaxID=53992 RepID=A0AA36HF59_CYLNA|nr:unnamed protein product [Cylicocyclus nassatus]